MNASTLGPWMVAILAWTVYIIVPTANIIYGIVTIIRMRKTISNMGELAVKLEPERASHIIFTSVSSFTIVIFSIFFFFAVSKIMGILIFTVFSQSWIHALKGDLFSKANGLYQKGFILNDDPLMWNKIHSYKLIPDGRVSLLTMQGARIDMPEILDFYVEDLIKKGGINHEE